SRSVGCCDRQFVDANILVGLAVLLGMLRDMALLGMQPPYRTRTQSLSQPIDQVGEFFGSSVLPAHGKPRLAWKQGFGHQHIHGSGFEPEACIEAAATEIEAQGDRTREG